MLGLPREAFLMGFCSNAKTVGGVPISKMGFAGDAISIKKPAEVKRILILGASVVFNRRFADKLKERLQRISPYPIEVVGAALRMHTSYSDLYKYEFLSRYKFDYVLIYNGTNDLWANHVAPYDFRNDYSQISAWYKRNWLLTHSVLYRSLYNKYIYRKPATVKEGSGLRSIEIYKANIERLIDLIYGDGGKVVLMSLAMNIPDNYSLDAFKSDSLGYNNPEQYDKCCLEVWGSKEYVKHGVEELNKAIRQIAKKRNTYLIPQDELMSADISLFGDPCHFSEKGTRKFINNIVEFFTEHKLFYK